MARWASTYKPIISKIGLGIPSSSPLPSQPKELLSIFTASGVPSVPLPVLALW